MRGAKLSAARTQLNGNSAGAEASLPFDYNGLLVIGVSVLSAGASNLFISVVDTRINEVIWTRGVDIGSPSTIEGFTIAISREWPAFQGQSDVIYDLPLEWRVNVVGAAGNALDIDISSIYIDE